MARRFSGRTTMSTPESRKKANQKIKANHKPVKK